MARTANFVAEYTAILGIVMSPAVDAVLTKCPKPCLRKTGSAAAHVGGSMGDFPGCSRDASRQGRQAIRSARSEYDLGTALSEQ